MEPEFSLESIARCLGADGWKPLAFFQQTRIWAKADCPVLSFEVQAGGQSVHLDVARRIAAVLGRPLDDFDAV